MTTEKPATTLGAKIRLALGAIFFCLLLLGLLEVGLRVVGLGAGNPASTSRLRYQQVYLPVLAAAERPDGTKILRPRDPRLPYQSILREKPANSLRVFIFGGSATAGLGYSPNATFSRHLERMLERAYPSRVVEVVNLGIVALSSKQVKLLVEDVCEHYRPDLLIVYSGNNEFLEIHAEKYAQANATVLSRVAGYFADTHLLRLITSAVHRSDPATPSLADVSGEELRRTQREIIEDIAMTAEEIGAVVDDYEGNLDAMVRVAKAGEVPILLVTVAANWKWRGRKDLPEGWLEEELGPEFDPSPSGRQRAIEILTGRLDAADERDRHEWLFKRAIVHEQLGDLDAARADYRAAMNADPHLRRALDAMNERVLAVANRGGVPALDVIEELSPTAPGGIIGFELLYDYVHFTPEGAIRVAAELYRALVDQQLIPAPDDFDAEEYARRQLDEFAALDGEDFIGVYEWLGLGFDPDAVGDRDLWKYDKMLDRLDERLEQDPNDERARIYRGNANFFRLGAKAAARTRADYERALELGGEQPEVKASLDRLTSERGG